MAREVLGEAFWRPSFLGHSRLDKLADLFRMSAEDLLWSHTVFPYATSALPLDAFERSLANALNFGSRGKGLGKIVAIASAGVPKRRLCRHCVREELAELSYSYWHRSHNLPAVWVCAKHRIALEETPIELSPDGSKDLRFPHECPGKPLLRADVPNTSLSRVAEISADWLTRPRGPGYPRDPDAYRHLADQSGWVAIGKRINTEQVTEQLCCTFGERFLACSSIPLEQRRGAWPFLMLRPGVSIAFTPAKHAVMQAFLERPRPAEAANLRFRPAGANPSPAELIDAFYAKAARRELAKVLRTKQVLTTEAFLRRVGCFSHYRRNRASLPELSAVVREFRSSPATVKRLAPGRMLFRNERQHEPASWHKRPLAATANASEAEA